MNSWKKIVVHERDRKGCQDTTQEVEIYFNFVGKYVPPHFGEISLTPEEQEALAQEERTSGQTAPELSAPQGQRASSGNTRNGLRRKSNKKIEAEKRFYVSRTWQRASLFLPVICRKQSHRRLSFSTTINPKKATPYLSVK